MSRRTHLLATGVALCAMGGLAGVGSIAGAVPPPAAPPAKFDAQPGALGFGGVLLGSESAKTVTLINRTNKTFVYKGAEWPNFGNPPGWSYPYGFWSISGDEENFPCWEIAPYGTCVLTFQFKPYALGSYGTTFVPHYGPKGGDTYDTTVIMRGVGATPSE